MEFIPGIESWLDIENSSHHIGGLKKNIISHCNRMKKKYLQNWTLTENWEEKRTSSTWWRKSTTTDLQLTWYSVVKNFFPGSRTEQRFLFTTLFNIILGVLANTLRHEKEIKGYKFGRERLNTFFFLQILWLCKKF